MYTYAEVDEMDESEFLAVARELLLMYDAEESQNSSEADAKCVPGSVQPAICWT